MKLEARRKLRDLAVRFIGDESATTTIEYAVIAGFLAVIVGGFSLIFDNLKENFLGKTQVAVGNI